MTAQLEELVDGGAALDALGDDAEIEGAAQLDDRLDDGPVAGVGLDPLHEGLVELEEVHRQVLELRERGVARPEVVDGHLDAEGLEPPQNARRLLGLLQHGVLGHFDAQALAGDAVAPAGSSPRTRPVR